MDISDKGAVDGLPAEAASRHGVVDGPIHCAGIIQPFVRLKDLDDAAIERVFAVNWWGTLHMTRAFLPILLARPEGHIVNLSSMGGFLPVPGQTIYGASKAAVKLLTEGLHAECRGTRVRVTVVFPGRSRRTSRPTQASTSRSRQPTPRRRCGATSPAKAAQVILDGMEKDVYRVFIGRDARMMDALYRINPKGAAGFIARQMKDLLPVDRGLSAYARFRCDRLDRAFRGGSAYPCRNASTIRSANPRSSAPPNITRK